MANKYLDLEGLGIYDEKIKEYITDNNKISLKFVEFKNNSIGFYTNNPKGEDEAAAFSIDLPSEYILDQAKTTFVEKFEWNEETYPDSTNPNLEGEPVLILAVNGEDKTNYSFLSMKKLVDIYVGGVTDSIEVSVDSATNTITANVKISQEDGNAISIKEDGLYVEPFAINTIAEADIDALFASTNQSK